MKYKKILLLAIFINIIFLVVNIFYYMKISNEETKYLSINTETNKQNSNLNKVDLQDLMGYLNTSADASLMTENFKFIKIAADPLYEFTKINSTDNENSALLSISYGIEGTYKLNDNTSIKVTIINDDTLNNGLYILTSIIDSFESSYYKVNNTFLVFDVFINDKLSDDEITKTMINIIEFKQKFYNHYNAYLENL